MTEALKIGVVMDPITSINYKKDTTVALLLAARIRNHSLFYMQLSDLSIENGQAYGEARPITVRDNPENWYDLGERRKQTLSDFDIILMRKDPPFNSQYIYATYILERAEQAGCLVVNKPQSLRDCNEKIYATEFPQCAPPHVVSNDPETLRHFHTRHGDVIFKPLDGMGGSGIFRCPAEDPNISVIIETLTEHGKRYIMAQKYLPEILAGDKRILIVNGEAIPYALARIPAAGETRGNLAAGGRGVVQALTKRDQWIADQVAPHLVKKGLLFVGLDVIGDYLTEINVTSPTCVREIDAVFDTRIGERLILALEKLTKRD